MTPQAYYIFVKTFVHMRIEEPNCERRATDVMMISTVADLIGRPNEIGSPVRPRKRDSVTGGRRWDRKKNVRKKGELR